MYREQEMVKAFHRIAGHPWAARPKMLPEDRVAFRASLIQEELDEFIEAKTIVDQVDALMDCMYFVLGSMVELGVDSEWAFGVVHQCNMNKFPGGVVKYREDGKVLKPDGWVGPEEILGEFLKEVHE